MVSDPFPLCLLLALYRLPHPLDAMLYYGIVSLTLGVMFVYDNVPLPLYFMLDKKNCTSSSMLDNDIIPLPLCVMFDYSMYLSP